MRPPLRLLVTRGRAAEGARDAADTARRPLVRRTTVRTEAQTAATDRAVAEMDTYDQHGDDR